MKTRVVAIVGPTGSGKARLALRAAEATNAILLSCDSMKVYRRMDVGTAKPAADQRGAWRGLDLVEPWESFDARRFVELFEATKAEADAQQRPLLLSGGTMLYLKTATEGLGEAPPRDAELRERLAAEAPSHELHRRLQEVDPVTAAKVHPNDLRRVVRALEVFTLSGRPQSSYHGQFGRVREDLDRRVFVVTREREDMDRRIDARVARMFAQGWVEECEALASDPRGLSREAGQALGYPQIMAWLASGRAAPLAEIRERIQTLTRRFARKQLTWIRNLGKRNPLGGEPPTSEEERRPAAEQAETRELPVHELRVDEGGDTLDHLAVVLTGFE